MSMMSLLPLMGKNLSQITLDDLNLVVKAMKLTVTPTEELRLAALQMLQGKDLNTVADLIQSPESIAQLGNFIQGKTQPEETRDVVKCPHCSGLFLN
jgi:hypothetical protein